jgi:hypothetical protein
MAISVRLPIRGYIQNYTHRTEGDSEPEFDGVVEVWGRREERSRLSKIEFSVAR